MSWSDSEEDCKMQLKSVCFKMKVLSQQRWNVLKVLSKVEKIVDCEPENQKVETNHQLRE